MPPLLQPLPLPPCAFFARHQAACVPFYVCLTPLSVLISLLVCPIMYYLQLPPDLEHAWSGFVADPPNSVLSSIALSRQVQVDGLRWHPHNLLSHRLRQCLEPTDFGLCADFAYDLRFRLSGSWRRIRVYSLTGSQIRA